MKVTLGGDRLGSGNKQDLHLHNYYRSTHNLSRKFASSMTCGALYPFMCYQVMRGDTFEIDLNAAARTIPTKGPLFGSFKLQTDVFFVPIRLYQGILHNNPLAIGLKMSQVKLPIMEIRTKCGETGGDHMISSVKAGAFSNSCLLKYIGLSGIGRVPYTSAGYRTRTFNAVPMLAYYDICKNYYCNKQEENAYVLGYDKGYYTESKVYTIEYGGVTIPIITITNTSSTYNGYSAPMRWLTLEPGEQENIVLKVNTGGSVNKITENLIVEINDEQYKYNELTDAPYIENVNITGQNITIEIDTTDAESNVKFLVMWKNSKTSTDDSIKIVPFTLTNIDDMRMKLLSHHTLGSAYKIDAIATTSENYDGLLPYSQITGYNESNESNNLQKLNGLMLKTYQADLFNAWVQTDWIDGENGIKEITKIAVNDGAVYIDSINLAEKLYNMLNRVAVSGGTYEDYQDAVWQESPKRHIESPVYLGGMSSEVVFEEIVQTAPAGDTTLGTLGGRGTLLKRKGGHINVKIDEAGYIIGITSLTPRVFYTQGNEFYMTDIKSLDDFHKPALDGIGFQDLLGERMAYWDYNTASANGERSKIGKVPAWIEYMTAVDQAYGDFAELDGNGFMILNRNYEANTENGKIKDATTYIDPQKYNYAFAYSELGSQNFWVEIDSKVIARRLMSAKQIPNM